MVTTGVSNVAPPRRIRSGLPPRAPRGTARASHPWPDGSQRRGSRARIALLDPRLRRRRIRDHVPGHHARAVSIQVTPSSGRINRERCWKFKTANITAASVSRARTTAPKPHSQAVVHLPTPVSFGLLPLHVGFQQTTDSAFSKSLILISLQGSISWFLRTIPFMEGIFPFPVAAVCLRTGSLSRLENTDRTARGPFAHPRSYWDVSLGEQVSEISHGFHMAGEKTGQGWRISMFKYGSSWKSDSP